MSVSPPEPSARHDELLERAYEYVLGHGIADLSLRPLARAIGSSPRVLLFLFASKEGLVKALLARARTDELALLEHVRDGGENADLPTVARALWRWLADKRHRGLLALWLESYARSLIEPAGAWSQFSSRTVEDWLELLGGAQPPRQRKGASAVAERTFVLAILRGALIDLLATGDERRTTAAVELALRSLPTRRRSDRLPAARRASVDPGRASAETCAQPTAGR